MVNASIIPTLAPTLMNNASENSIENVTKLFLYITKKNKILTAEIKFILVGVIIFMGINLIVIQFCSKNKYKKEPILIATPINSTTEPICLIQNDVKS